MNFTNLYTSRRELETLSESIDISADIQKKIMMLNYNCSSLHGDLAKVTDRFHSMLKLNTEAKQQLADMIQNVDNEILRQAELLLEDTTYYGKFSIEYLKNLGGTQSCTPNESFFAAIKKYHSWQYPVVYVNHKNYARLSEHLVAADPLYVISSNQDILDHEKNSYSEQYQKRLRLYLFNERILSDLPQNQFGLVLCFDFLNLLNTHIIQQYIKKLYDLCRPGGVCIFTYNNAEIPSMAERIDLQELPWASKSYVEHCLKQAGFEVIAMIDDLNNNNTMSWAEARKPGELKTIKASAVLGQIGWK